MKDIELVFYSLISGDLSLATAEILQALLFFAHEASWTREAAFWIFAAIWLSFIGKKFMSTTPTVFTQPINYVSTLILYLLGIVGFMTFGFSLLMYEQILVSSDAEYLEAFKWAYGQIITDSAIGAAISVFIGFLSYFWVKRVVEPRFGALLKSLGGQYRKKTGFPDAKDISEFLPKPRFYDTRKYFEKARKLKSIFLGLDESSKGIYVAIKQFCALNMIFFGAPGAGKGVGFCNVLWQLIVAKFCCLVFNPKPDEFARFVLQKAAEIAGVKFIRIDLRADFPCINPLFNISEIHLYELLIGTFNLSRTGSDSDYYRNYDRRAAKILSRLANSHDDLTLTSLARIGREKLGDDKHYDNLLCQLEELAELPAVQTFGDSALQKIIEHGGCVLFEGDTLNESVITLMKLISVRCFQLVKDRNDKSRPVTFAIDEAKYLISKPFISATGTFRDKNAHFILTTQSLSDLRTSDSNLDPDIVKEVLIGNMQIKWAYKCVDPELSSWISQLAGTTSAVEEVEVTQSNDAAAVTPNLGSTFKTVEKPLIHPNILLQLHKFCGVLIGATTVAQIAFSCPTQIEKVATESHQLGRDPSLTRTYEDDELL